MSKESFPQISHLIQDDRLFLIAPRKKLTQEVCDRLRKYEGSSRENRGLYDEQIWTLLFTYGFVAGSGSLQSLSDLAKVLTEGEGAWAPDHEARLEMLPVSPRRGILRDSEGNTEIDLILGDIAGRNRTPLSFAFKSNGTPSWICMVEAKWLSDIACRTSHDLHWNQLIRVIETALSFQTSKGQTRYPDQVHVTLLTPGTFRHDGEPSGSRFYYYKYNEYKQYPYLVLTDLGRAAIQIHQGFAGWSTPEDLMSHLDKLRLHWVTYEELFERMPDSEFKVQLKEFIASNAHGVISV
jgi:hypothetical protein